MSVNVLGSPRGETPAPACHELEPFLSLHVIKIWRD